MFVILVKLVLVLVLVLALVFALVLVLVGDFFKTLRPQKCV